MKFRLLSTLGSLLSLSLAAVTLVRAQTSDSPKYFFTTFAGTASAGSADGTGSTARFNGPVSCVMDKSGNTYVTDSFNRIIRKISASGVVTTLAGKPGFIGSDDGTGDAARFSFPLGIAIDATGNLFVTDSQNHTIRKITPAGVVTTVAGQAGISGSADGNGSTARFNQPVGIAIDTAGNLYVADQKNFRVRKITATGVVSTVAGDHEDYFGSDGPISTALFGLLNGIAVDQSGNVYVTDRNKLRKITPGTDVTTLATFFYFTSPYKGSYEGELWGLIIDATGNLYTSDSDYGVVGKYSATGGSSLVIVPPLFAASNPSALVTTLEGPHGIAFDQGGNLILVETTSNTLKKITTGGAVSILAGLPPSESAGSADGTGTSARFSGPDGMAVGPTDEIYVADSRNHVIRKITPAGVVTTIAGKAGTPDYVDGPLTTARFSSPRGLAMDAGGNLFVADEGNSVIRKISSAGIVSTVSGQPGKPGHTDGPAGTAQFSLPAGVAVDATGTLFIAEYGAIRRVSPSGEASYFASASLFHNPIAGLATDAAGNLYWSDSDSMVIKKLASPSTAAATAAASISTASAPLHPNRIFVDRSGQIYATSDYYPGATQVHKVAADGSVQTLGGQPYVTGNTDGFGLDAIFNGTQGIVVDRAGNIYVSCFADNTIRKGVLSGPPVISTQPANQSVAVGGSVQFSVAATGTPTPTYQWYVGGTALNGATGNSLSMTNARSTDAGDYTVVVTNVLGSVTSNKATLTVTATPTPPSSENNPTSGAGSGGGSTGIPFVLALAALIFYRRKQS